MSITVLAGRALDSSHLVRLRRFLAFPLYRLGGRAAKAYVGVRERRREFQQDL